ncbi:MAG: SPOR domain-containing protein [Ignavibacteriales bacterium]|nr:SPOR domain-containing protein [Ignavibacteriales bacterium]
MPNLNVKGEAPRPSAGGSGGGGGIPKVVIIIIGAIVVLGAAAFILNTTGVVKLWGKKKAQPVLVTVPSESLPPVTQDTVVPPPEESQPVDAVLEENLTKLESNAKPVVSTAKRTIVTGTGMYTVQISSWPEEIKANKQAQVFSDAGFEAFVEPLGGYYRVCIGRYETKAAAKEQMQKMEHMLESMPIVAKVGK